MAPQDMDCFGVDWQGGHPECAGGPDPLYTNPATGTHVRERCAEYEACGRTVRAAESQRKLAGVAQQQVVPAHALLRQQQQMVSPYPASLQQRQAYAPPQPPQRPAYAPQPPPQPPQYQLAPPPPPPQMMNPAQYYPAVYSPAQQLLPHEAAAYLTVPEGPQEGVPLWRRVLAESLRAGFKGVLQQGAFIVDHTPCYLPEIKK